MGIGPAAAGPMPSGGDGEARNQHWVRVRCREPRRPRVSGYPRALPERHSHKTWPALCRFSLTCRPPRLGQVHQTVLGQRDAKPDPVLGVVVGTVSPVDGAPFTMQADQKLVPQNGPGRCRVDDHEVPYVSGVGEGLFAPLLVTRTVVLVPGEQPVVMTPF